MEPFVSEHEGYLLLKEWQKLLPNLTAGFTTRNGGYSKEPFHQFNLGLHVNDEEADVHANRKKLSSMIGFDTGVWVCADQIHHNKIQKVTNDDRGKGVFHYNESIKATDGLYTGEADLLLTSCYADCVPLFFISPQKKLIGLAHAGWKGTVKGIGIEMAKAWELTEGVTPDQIFVAIGPSIQGCCYEVDDKVISEVQKVLSEYSISELPYKEKAKGKYVLSLPLLNKQLLLKAGLLEQRIQMSSLCTSCEDGVFFSHRRDKGQTGRMMSFIGYKEE